MVFIIIGMSLRNWRYELRSTSMLMSLFNKKLVNLSVIWLLLILMIRCETSRTALGPLCPTAPSMLPGVNSSDLQIVDDDTDKLTITVEHPYLASVGLDDDLIAGIQYEVHIGVTDEDAFDLFILQSNQFNKSFGVFTDVISQSKTMICDRKRNVIYSKSLNNFTSLNFFWTIDNETRIEYANFTAHLRLKKKWYRKTIVLRQKQGCQTYLTAYGGSFQEVDFPTDDHNCSEKVFVIPVPNTFRTVIQFQVVSFLYNKFGCSKEYIEVLSVPDNWTSYKFCGYLDDRKFARLHFVSQREAIILRTKLLSSSTFKAFYYVLDRRKGCNTTISSAGKISSLNYPEPYYPGLDCYIDIRVPEGQTAVLRLLQLHLKINEDGLCGLDYLEIIPSTGTRRKFCGSLQQYTAQYSTYFTSNDVMLHFHSDWLGGGRGYLIDYAVSTACGSSIHRNRSGTIFTLGPTSDLFSIEGQSDWENCTTTIHVPYGYHIELVVSTDLEGNYTAGSDAIQFSKVTQSVGDTLNSLIYNCSEIFIELVDQRGSYILCGLKSVVNGNYLSKSNTLLVSVFRDKSKSCPRTTVSYVAVENNRSQSACPYGWVAGMDYCYLMDETPLSWIEAKHSCTKKGGRLVSIPNSDVQKLLDAIIDNSLLQDDNEAVWTGGNDRIWENYYEWADGKSVSFTHWFKGWPQFHNYNRQPNDDGLSNQDCIEMRRTFGFPTKGSGKLGGFFWNDRDCSVANPFICEKLKIGATDEPYPKNCNMTVMLTSVRPKDVIMSPSYPDPYPDNMDCTITLTAQLGQKIVLTFSTFILEDGNGQLCQYDYLEILSHSSEPRRFCGDKSSELKLLRYESAFNHLTLRFVSDHSHSFPGFFADVHIEETAKNSGNSQCDNGKFLQYKGNCYLLETFPHLSWHTASKICLDIQSHLTSLESKEEEDFLLEQLSKKSSQSKSSIIWIGGHRLSSSSPWTWTDNSSFSYSDKMSSIPSGREMYPAENSGRSKELCLSLTLGHHQWVGHNCSRPGGYICKKKGFPLGQNFNSTISEKGVNITSPNFPDFYPNNLHYVVTLLGPPQSRIVVKFLYLNLEWQQDCLYDYVGLQSSESSPMIRWCNLNKRDDKNEFIADGNVTFLTFHSDYDNNEGGFVATWKAVDISSCPTKTVESVKGTLTSVNYPDMYFDSMNCETIIEAPTYYKWMWIEFDSFVVGSERGGNPIANDCIGDFVQLSMGNISSSYGESFRLCGNLTLNLPNLAFIGEGNSFKLAFHSDVHGNATGFRAHYKALKVPVVDRIIPLLPNVTGSILDLNVHFESVIELNYTRTLFAPVGYLIQLHLEGIVIHGSNVNSSMCSCWSMEISDPYQTQDSPLVTLCRSDNISAISHIVVRSHFNVLILTELASTITAVITGYFKITYSVLKDDEFINKTIIGPRIVERCYPNPCLNNGHCIDEDRNRVCNCSGHFTGMFCHLTVCDLNPCVHGMCNLTDQDYVCICDRGYGGLQCDIKLNPCGDNPCQNSGTCVVDKDQYICKCQILFQGPRCENRILKIPFKPLSQRMLEEPFWLGLITVFVVLAVLGFVWCIKRKFADKLEKFFAEEIEKSKQIQSCKVSKRHSLREPSSPVSLSPQTCPKSLFSRIGLRKHSMLSLDSSGSPNYHENRSFSFDDIIKKSDSQKKLDKRSTSPAQFDKKELLHSLVAPPVSPKERRMSLDEFIQMSEKKILQRQNSRESALESTQETSFTKNDPTFRKRVNFVRRLEKIDSVSFENDREEDPSCVVQKDRDIELSGNDIGEYSDVGSPCSSRRSESYRGIDLCGVDYDTEKQSERRDDTSNVLRVHHSVGVDQSDCSSAEVDSSWTSSEVLNHIRSEVQVEIHEAPRDTEESTENTAEERNNEVQCESQLPNQRRALPSNLETSKGIVESGCCYTASDTGQKDGTIQVHHYCPSTGGDDGTQTESGFLRPPIGNDLLTKSDLGTPVMTSWEGSAGCDGHHKHSSLRTTMMPKTDFASLVVPTSPPLSISEKGHRKAPARDPSLKVPSHRPGSPTVGLLLKQHQLPLPPPRVEVSAYHLLEHSKPSKSRPPPLDILPQVLTPLSPYRKRIHVMEKTGSLDLPAPLITITTNVSSCESDTDSPTKTAANMHYLSPFDLIRQSTEHSTSLSNLSSSGYSSMASPGPSRCNSNSPLFGSDPDGDPNCISPGLRHSPSSIARKYGQHLCPSNIPYPVSPRHCPTGAAIHKTMLNNALGGVGRRFRPPLLRAATSIRKRSDSETTDEQPEPGSLQEDSNDDEGIGMDHIDFKIHRGEVTSAEDLELYMDREKASPIEDPTGKPLVGSREEESMGHSGGRELVCPAIVVQTLLQNEPDRDRCWKFVRRKSFQHRLSPVSSRSESPMSDRGCQNSNDKFASSFFGNDETHATDSDDLYNDGTCSPEDDIKLPVEPKPPTVTPQNRKQSRKTNKSHGCKAKSCTKLRPKSMSEMTCKDISCKRSPKRRLRVQNSVDDDSSSTESSSASGSPKEPLLFKDRRNNRIDSIHQHRKRYMARCESSPLPIARNGTWDSDDCSSRSGPKSAPGPLIDLDDHGSPSFVLDINNVHESKVMNEKNGDLHTPSSLPPYCNDVLDGDEAFEIPSNNINGCVTNHFTPTSFSDEENLADRSSPSDEEFWRSNGPRQDSESSDLSDEDSGSEVSFYLNNRKAIHTTESQRLISPARISPDMEVICYSGGGFGQWD